MKHKHEAILNKIFSSPVQSSIVWRDVELMLFALGAEIKEGSGSQVSILLNHKRATFHRPHPRKEADKGAIVALRKFLISTGVRQC